MKSSLTRKTGYGCSAITLLVALFFIFPIGTIHAAIVDPPCQGKWLNPIGDICWRCLLPISIGSAQVFNDSSYPDSPNPGAFVCVCPTPKPPWIRIGLSVGVWEPTYLAEVTRSPYCFINLGGTKLDVGIFAAEGTHDVVGNNKNAETSFYQVHWMPNFWTEWLTDELDSLFQETSLGTTYLTELDPTWDDDEMSALFDPESFLFANPIAQAACAADCIAATAGTGFETLFWCAGCQGGVYPLSGHVVAHEGGVQASARLVERLGYKLSRIGSLLGMHAHTPLDYCYPHYDPIIDKRQFRTQITYPIPETTGVPGLGCCQPFGRSSFLWGSGREFPYSGEDFSYIVWQKRHGCMSY